MRRSQTTIILENNCQVSLPDDIAPGRLLIPSFLAVLFLVVLENLTWIAHRFEPDFAYLSKRTPRSSGESLRVLCVARDTACDRSWRVLHDRVRGDEMNTLASRVLGSAILQARSYEEVEADHTANWQAIAVVLLSSFGAAIGIRLRRSWTS